MPHHAWTFWRQIYLLSVQRAVSDIHWTQTKKPMNWFYLIHDCNYCNCRLPWNQQTVIGFLGDLLVTIGAGSFYLLYNGIFVALFVSICLHHRAFYRMYECLVQRLDEPDNSRSDQEILREIVDLQVLTKEWVSILTHLFSEQAIIELNCCRFFPRWFFESAEAYSQIIMIQIIGSMLSLAGGIFGFDQVQFLDTRNIYGKYEIF